MPEQGIRRHIPDAGLGRSRSDAGDLGRIRLVGNEHAKETAEPARRIIMRPQE